MIKFGKYTLFLMLLMGSSLADVDNEDSVISDMYTRGKYAIYDCQQKHLVCADKSSFRTCTVSNLKSSPCVKLKEFSSSRDCELKIQKWIYRNFSAEFCNKFNPSF